MNVHYRIQPLDPAAHLFEVKLIVTEPSVEGQRLSMPAWIPGSYMIRDFARNVVQLRAECEGRPVPAEKIDKQTWQCAPCPGPLAVIYEVYCWDLSVRSAHLDQTHGYFNGTSVFLKVHGREHEPCSVEILPPEGDAFSRWRVATTLPRREAAEYGFGSYEAADYDELVDHPVEMGDFTLLEFEACGIPHAMAITGRHHADTERLARDLKPICEYHIGLFGEAPVQRYLFQTMVVGDGYGGLEHRSSTSLLCSRDDLPRVGQQDVSDDYRGFLGLCSHEYFHTWNIKRIKPAVFHPYDLSQEVHTNLLWAFEGITSYYDDMALARCGLISSGSYLELLGQTITRVLRGSGRLKQTVQESSFDTWTKFYKQDENAPNAIVSYYAKGALVALALDLTIRAETKGEKSLDDVMRGLWERFGKPGIGVTEDGLESFIEEVTELRLREFFDHALRSTEDLPFAELFDHVGIDYCLRPAEADGDKGGKPPSGKANARKAALGVRSTDDPLGARLMNVYDGSAAQMAGLSAGDVIVALDGIRVTKGNLEKRLTAYNPGETVSVHAFRRDELMQFELRLQPLPKDTCYLVVRETPTAAQQALRGAWLKA